LEAAGIENTTGQVRLSMRNADLPSSSAVCGDSVVTSQRNILAHAPPSFFDSRAAVSYNPAMPQKNYESLLEDVAALHEENLRIALPTRNFDVLCNYWRMGRHIVDVEQDKQARARYGANVIRRLSADLTARYRKGFSRRMLEYMRSLALEYRMEALSPGLTWNHYLVLLGVEDRTRRRELEKQAIREELSNTTLRLLAESKDPSTVDLDKALVLRKGRVGIYKVLDVREDGTALLDCGFRSEMAAVVKGGAVVGTYLSSSLAPVDCEPGERYCYDGEVMEVVDGDTVWVRISLGFGMYRRERLRLRSVGAAELGCEEGEAARAFVARRLRPGAPVRVLTYNWDVHGRYVADLFYGKGGRQFLNRILLEEGVAQFVDTRG